MNVSTLWSRQIIQQGQAVAGGDIIREYVANIAYVPAAKNNIVEVQSVIMTLLGYQKHLHDITLDETVDSIWSLKKVYRYATRKLKL